MIYEALHYATILRQGIDDWDDFPWTYSLPAFGSGQGRIWDPQNPPQGALFRVGTVLTIITTALATTYLGRENRRYRRIRHYPF